MFHLVGVGICRVGDFNDLLQEVVVDCQRLGDADEFIAGLPESFFGHQSFFVGLFPGSQSGVDDLDIDIRPMSGELDEVAGEGVDFHGLAHVEDVDFAAIGVCGCL